MMIKKILSMFVVWMVVLSSSVFGAYTFECDDINNDGVVNADDILGNGVDSCPDNYQQKPAMVLTDSGETIDYWKTLGNQEKEYYCCGSVEIEPEQNMQPSGGQDDEEEGGTSFMQFLPIILGGGGLVGLLQYFRNRNNGQEEGSPDREELLRNRPDYASIPDIETPRLRSDSIDIPQNMADAGTIDGNGCNPATLSRVRASCRSIIGKGNPCDGQKKVSDDLKVDLDKLDEDEKSTEFFSCGHSCCLRYYEGSEDDLPEFCSYDQENSCVDDVRKKEEARWGQVISNCNIVSGVCNPGCVPKINEYLSWCSDSENSCRDKAAKVEDTYYDRVKLDRAGSIVSNIPLDETLSCYIDMQKDAKAKLSKEQYESLLSLQKADLKNSGPYNSKDFAKFPADEFDRFINQDQKLTYEDYLRRIDKGYIRDVVLDKNSGWLNPKNSGYSEFGVEDTRDRIDALHIVLNSRPDLKLRDVYSQSDITEYLKYYGKPVPETIYMVDKARQDRVDRILTSSIPDMSKRILARIKPKSES